MLFTLMPSTYTILNSFCVRFVLAGIGPDHCNMTSDSLTLIKSVAVDFSQFCRSQWNKSQNSVYDAD